MMIRNLVVVFTISIASSHALNIFNPLERKSDSACEEIKIFATHLNSSLDDDKKTDVGEFPHQVALGYKFSRTNDIIYACGGSLISQNFVLSASHCVSRKNRQPSFVLIGRTSLNLDDADDNSKPIKVDIKKIFINPNYRAHFKYDDIALIELVEPVIYSKFLKPACLDTTSTDLRDAEMIATGWGREAEWLKKSIKSELSLDECNSVYKNVSSKTLPDGLRNTQMCTYGNINDYTPCTGDGGGPLQIKKIVQSSSNFYYTVVGVTSFGMRCGAGQPDVYTRVSQYLDWIESIVWP